MPKPLVYTLLVILLLSVGGCIQAQPALKPAIKADATSTATPLTEQTPKPTFKQERAEMVDNLRTVNKVDTDLNEVISYIKFTVEDKSYRPAIRPSAYEDLYGALNGALQRSDNLTDSLTTVRGKLGYEELLHAYAAAAKKTLEFLAINEENKRTFLEPPHRQYNISLKFPSSWRIKILNLLDFSADAGGRGELIYKEQEFLRRKNQWMVRLNIPHSEVAYYSDYYPKLSKAEVIANVQMKGIPLLEKSGAASSFLYVIPERFTRTESTEVSKRLWTANYLGEGIWEVEVDLRSMVKQSIEKATWFYFEKTGAVRFIEVVYPSLKP